MAAAIPGTPEYYKLPQAQRIMAMNAAKAQTGGAEAMLLYLTPAEYRFITAASIPQGDWADQVRKDYPDQAPYLAIPELANIIHLATAAKWSPDKMLSALQATDWWTKRSADQRSWYLQNMSDPGTAAQRVQQQANTILHSAQQLGVAMSGGQATILATQSLMNGWDPTQLTDHILQGNLQGYSHGTLGSTKDALAGKADQYTVPVSQGGLDTWTRNIISGRATQEGFEDYLRRQAKSLYRDPNLHKALDEGMTVKDYADPYIQSAAQLLGLNPNDVDLSQAKWNRALQFTDTNGTRRSMTLDEWNQNLRVDPIYGYDHSTRGKAEAATLIDAIRQKWGFS